MTEKAKDTQDEESKAFGWDDPIDPTKQGKEFILLPDGKAYFTCMKLDRERKEFGKFGVIPVAVLHLMVTSAEEGATSASTELQVQLGLHTDLMWKITEFFTALGQRKHGDTGMFVPRWDKVEGEPGQCMIGHREFTSKRGKVCVTNEITKFGWPEEKEDNLKF